MKTCTECGKSLEDKEFINGNKELKRCNKCRSNAKRWSKTYFDKHPEKKNVSQKKHREAHIDEIREKDKLLKRKLRKENPEKMREIQKKSQEKNFDKNKARDKNRMINRPEYFLFSSARERARERGLEFNITERDVKELLENITECPLRKVKFERGSNGKPTDNSISLDRIDSSKGYLKDNIQIISHLANLVKNTADLDVFRKIVNNFKNHTSEAHNIDNNTIKIIIEDRQNQIKNNNYDKDKELRIINIENWLFQSARKRTKRIGVPIDIDVNYIKSIWSLDNRCPILGEKFIYGDGYMSPFSATIDRIEPKKGYVKDNIRIISAKANTVKNKCTLEELEFILKNWEELETKRKKN